MQAEKFLGIPRVVLLAFTRLMTHPALCRNPLTVAEAKARVDLWLEPPQVRVLCPSEETLGAFFECLAGAGLGGNLATDALIAGHALENSGTVHSNDRDFERFPRLRVRNPLRA